MDVTVQWSLVSSVCRVKEGNFTNISQEHISSIIKVEKKVKHVTRKKK
jgi:hypothetical protein